MLQHLLNVYAMNLKRLGMHVQDLSAEQMVEQPSGVINHPAWTLGHLAATADNVAKTLGQESTFPEEWRAACSTGGTPSGDAADFPSKEQLLEQLGAQHERVAAALAAADAELLDQPHPNPRGRKIFRHRRRLRRGPDDHPRGQSPRAARRLAPGHGARLGDRDLSLRRGPRPVIAKLPPVARPGARLLQRW